MATFSRVSPTGWSQGDNASNISRVSPTGWEQSAAVITFLAAWTRGSNILVGRAMKKNTSGQIIGVQMISATDGSAFTGAVSALVTKDGGSQTAGGGTVTHEGNGFHSYTITQSETDADHVAVTFTGTGAVPATIQVYTSFPQTGDSFARLGAPAGASVSADVAAIKTQTAAIEVDTQDIQSRLPAALVSGRIDASVGAIASGVDLTATMKASVNAEVDTAIADVGLTSTVTGRIDVATSTRASQTSVDTLAGYVDTEVAAIKIVTDKLNTTLGAAVGSPGEYEFTADALRHTPGGATPAAIADAVWDEAMSGHTGADTYGGRIVRAHNSNVELMLTGSYHAAADVHEFQPDVLTSTAIAADAITAAKVASDVSAEIADAVWDEAISGHVSAGTTGESLNNTDLRGERTVVRGTVGTSTTPSTTQFTPSSITPAGAVVDQFKGRIIIFDNDTTTAALRGQATDITNNSGAATPLFTFTSLTTAPNNGDTFSIV